VETVSALEFKGVKKTFLRGGSTVQALVDISFHISPGKVTGLIGPDGAGKTTLMRLATGLLIPDQGHIQALGIDVLKEPLQIQSLVGYMPQRFGLYEDLTVQENLNLYADLQGVAKVDRVLRYQELMHMTGLAPFTSRLAGKLSGGMKQKLGLACTLVRPPQLLLLDEPTVGVDPVSRRELWSIVYGQVKEGMSVLLSTAYLDEAERCHEVILMHQGKRLGQGSPHSFSEPLRGRVFHVTMPSVGKRSLSTRLNATSGIIDAIIEGEKVRIVTVEASMPDLSKTLTDISDLKIEAAEPIFEDAFIATLKVDQTTIAQQNAPLSDVSKTKPKPIEKAIIEVNDLQRRFGNFYAVNGVSFSVVRGEIFGLLGANGAGKSTTFRMLCGLLPVTSGELHIAGLDLRHTAGLARGRLGYMAQRFSLYVNLTVEQNLRFFASAYGLNRSKRKKQINWALTAFELTSYRDTVSGDLPLGYKQRLAMAAALMHEPDILFLDEPTSGVDPLARREFWQRINALAESGVTILVTTHFMDEANYCDRLVIMAEGKVLAEGTPADMKARFRSQQHPDPTMEDAFIGLIEASVREKEDAA
jgi:drug efflux transport system ATP-binding protein